MEFYKNLKLVEKEADLDFKVVKQLSEAIPLEAHFNFDQSKCGTETMTTTGIGTFERC